jgi:hypothetical protein
VAAFGRPKFAEAVIMERDRNEDRISLNLERSLSDYLNQVGPGTNE